MFPKPVKSFIGDVAIPNNALPNRENDFFIAFPIGSRIFFIALPNGLATFSVNELTIGSVTLCIMLLTAFFASSSINNPACLIGAKASIIGLNTFDFKNPYILSFTSEAFILSGFTTAVSNQLVNLVTNPPYLLPSTSFSPNKNSWNLSDDAVIPPANPNIAPRTGPPGSKNDGNNPTPCATPAITPEPPKNAASFGFEPSPVTFPILFLYNFPKAPFIIERESLSLKSLPYKNSWKASDLVINPPAAPNIAPVTGPPGKKNEGKNPTAPPRTAPFLIVPPFFSIESTNDLGINPPIL